MLLEAIPLATAFNCYNSRFFPSLCVATLRVGIIPQYKKWEQKTSSLKFKLAKQRGKKNPQNTFVGLQTATDTFVSQQDFFPASS